MYASTMHVIRLGVCVGVGVCACMCVGACMETCEHVCVCAVVNACACNHECGVFVFQCASVSFCFV